MRYCRFFASTVRFFSLSKYHHPGSSPYFGKLAPPTPSQVFPHFFGSWTRGEEKSQGLVVVSGLGWIQHPFKKRKRGGLLFFCSNLLHQTGFSCIPGASHAVHVACNFRPPSPNPLQIFGEETKHPDPISTFLGQKVGREMFDQGKAPESHGLHCFPHAHTRAQSLAQPKRQISESRKKVAGNNGTLPPLA